MNNICSENFIKGVILIFQFIYISVFNGLTGEVMDTKPYIPERGDVKDWGDNRGNRSERYLAAVGYFGGKQGTASAVFCIYVLFA